VLLHGLEQRRLRLGRCAVDLVGQHDVGEDRTRREDHLALPAVRVLLDQVGTGDVRGHQVRRELDAREPEVEHLGDALDQQRLGEAGNARDDAIAAHEQRRQHQLHDVVLAHDLLAQLVDDAVAALLQLVGEGGIAQALGCSGLIGHVLPLLHQCVMP
jgi:hypothetical protein